MTVRCSDGFITASQRTQQRVTEQSEDPAARHWTVGAPSSAALDSRGAQQWTVYNGRAADCRSWRRRARPYHLMRAGCSAMAAGELSLTGSERRLIWPEPERSGNADQSELDSFIQASLRAKAANLRATIQNALLAAVAPVVTEAVSARLTCNDLKNSALARRVSTGDCLLTNTCSFIRTVFKNIRLVMAAQESKLSTNTK